MIKIGSLVRYNSRLLLVLGRNPDEYGYADGWWRCSEIGTNRIRIYCPKQLAIVKSEKEFYL
jgi:hypothetical protein